MQIGRGNFFIPVICEETGWYGGEYSFYFPDYLDEKTARRYAFVYLEQRIVSGMAERKNYGSPLEV